VDEVTQWDVPAFGHWRFSENDTMASLYKKPVFITDPRTGKRIKTKSKKWWGRFRDENGLEKRVPLAADKTAAQTMLHDLVVKVERRVAGIEDPFEKHRKRPLKDHLADFKACLENKGATPDYVNTTHQRAEAIVLGCKFERIDQISASRVLEYLADLREKGKSIASSNHYLQAIKMFTRWLVRDRRTNDDRLVHLSKMNAELDRRRVRRPLSMDEFGRILQAAEKGSSIQGVSGPDRAVIYVVGAYTGYRRNEIGSVTRRSFDFDAETPTLTVAAGYSKHRRQDVIPLRADFAERIRTWLDGKTKLRPDQPLFNIADKKTAEMIQKDMAAARKAWLKEATDEREIAAREQSSFLLHVDQNGFVVDFHALRKTFITNLTRSGVAPKTAQLLARHSDINLTMNTYTMLGVHDQATAVEALPSIPSVSTDCQPQRALATGTDGRNLADDRKKMVPTVVPSGAEIGAERLASGTLRIAPDCTETEETRSSPRRPDIAKSPVKTGASRARSHRTASQCSEVPEEGLEPSRPCGHWILNPARLPFRHSG
jgi:integrase/recombinase XerD